PGREFEATRVSYHSDDRAAGMELNIERAYPPEAGIEQWRRVLRLDREKNQVEITDRYRLKKTAGKITLTLMTPVPPKETGPGELALGGVRIRYDGRALKPVIEAAKVEDPHLRSVWGELLYRVLLAAERPPAEGEFSVRITQT
ncbi:MAG: hypothetical protein NTY38_19640, partial [Acidobacteria bacterium]|nr:hypothetical protein [Acidobacteriota bacterium]